ncbi:MAG: family NAD(P)-dependent oxidoreductase [Candidatus Saccharibacteria bacterium]|nr:family NAD(P)-dependent oxidoreductase [Candidatus Saccharibacteria bacterium]
MARVFITGSADGLGSLAAQALVEQGHQVVLHARNEERARVARVKVPEAEDVLIADLSDLEAVKKLAEEVNQLGHFDAVIYNAGVYQAPNEQVFAVNSLAPYVLTCLINKPDRLIYISSGLHRSGDVDIQNIATNTGYSDSKLQVLLLAKAVARLWASVYANAVDPGWVPTKMGGSGASDDLQQGVETQVWLAVGDDAVGTGRYYFHRQEDSYSPKADDIELQDKYLACMKEVSGIEIPRI